MSLSPEYKTDRKIATKLPRVWDAFFSKYGRFTEIQRQAIPPILEGRDTVLCAATASGKTEAACAPLLERNLEQHGRDWTILYVCPTRALVNDLFARLEIPLVTLGLHLVRRTGDHPTPLVSHPQVLLTTPESFDSVLCRGVFEGGTGHALGAVTAVVLDEIHLLHGSPRGEMVKWLLKRLRLLRKYAWDQSWCCHDEVQVVALSATIAKPGSVVSEYLSDGLVIHVPGSRQIEVVSEGSPSGVSLLDYLEKIDRPEKILVFCNSRKRADTLAHEMAEALEARNYKFAVHHGSMPKKLREEAEEKFHREKKIVVFATSTLELGIDIGDIDLIVLDAPPPDVNSLLQRIGRGNRRRNETRVMMCSENQREQLFQTALITAAQQSALNDSFRGPHQSVALQQVASYVFQAPDLTRPRKMVEQLVSLCGTPGMAELLVPHMLETGELVPKRDGLALGSYWIEQTELGRIHSVIESGGGSSLIDNKTGETIATGIHYQGGGGFHIQGRAYEVQDVELDGRIIGGMSDKKQVGDGKWRYATSGRFRPQSPAGEVRSLLGFGETDWILFRSRWLFHFGGAARRVVLTLLTQDEADIDEVSEMFIRFRIPIQHPIRWMALATNSVISAKIPEFIDSLEHRLGLPYASRRLPLPLRVEQVTRWLDIDHEITAIKSARIIEAQNTEQEEALSVIVEGR